jgi:hypothetical protein
MKNKAKLNLALLLNCLWNFVPANEKFPGVAIVAVFCTALAVVSHAQSSGKPAPSYSDRASSPAKPVIILPEGLVSAQAEVKAKSRIAVLLPSELPQLLVKAKYAIVATASKDEYVISLYYKLGVGDSGFAAFFAANAHPNYGPEDIENVSEVKLSRGLVGYFRPISCGGSCAPANLWWEDNQILYQIQLNLSSALPEHAQQRAIITAVDSAILAGPR